MTTDLSKVLLECFGKQFLTDDYFSAQVCFQDSTSCFASLLAVRIADRVAVIDYATQQKHVCLSARDNACINDSVFGYFQNQPLLLTIGDDDCVTVWDLSSGHVISRTDEQAHTLCCIACDRDLGCLGGNRGFVYVGNSNGDVLCFRLEQVKESSKKVALLEETSISRAPYTSTPEQDQNVVGLSLTPSGALVVAYPSQIIKLDPMTGAKLVSHRLQDNTCSVFSACGSGTLSVHASCLTPGLSMVMHEDWTSVIQIEADARAQATLPQKKWDKVAHPLPKGGSTLMSRSPKDKTPCQKGEQPKSYPSLGNQAENESENQQEDESEDDKTWSVFPDVDPCESSPLRSSHLSGGDCSEKTSSNGKAGQGNPSSKNLNKPVTFHKIIRSSGYGASAPRRPAWANKRGAKSKVARGIGEALKNRLAEEQLYPRDCGLINELVELGDAIQNKMSHAGAALKVAFSTDGSLLGSCSTDKSARVMRLPIGRYKGSGVNLMGHQQSVNSIDFSFASNLIKPSFAGGSSSSDKSGGGPSGSGPLVLTSSDDGTAKLWCTTRPDSLVTFSSSYGKQSIAGGSSKSNKGVVGLASAAVAAGPPVSEAKFFYMDKFVLASAGSRLGLYTYHLDQDAANPSKDLATQQKRNKLRQSNIGESVRGSANQAIVQVWDCKFYSKSQSSSNCNTDVSRAQSITSFAAINSFLSHLILVARSDRTVCAVDAASNKVCRLLSASDIGDRAVHSIALPTASTNAAHPTSAFDLFATSSTEYGGTVALWDLRTRERVQSFQGHRNAGRLQNIGLAISPCMRYVASGSEDNSLYIYDVRMGQAVEKLWDKHRDTVSDVAYHPLHPILATSCLDGKLRLYKERKHE